MAVKFEISKDKAGKYFLFRVKAANGEKIAVSTRNYEEKEEVEKDIWSVRTNAAGAAVVDLTELASLETRPSEDIEIVQANFTRLRSDGRKLIVGWLRRARHGLIKRPDDPFESFIYVWIAFNGWGACCFGVDKDLVLVNAMASDPTLQREFDDLLQKYPACHDAADAFRGRWPIYRVEHLRREKDDPERAPTCYEKHVTANGGFDFPLDWAHYLHATYRVRCNLFHGDKSAHSPDDKAIVSAAANTLVPFLERLLGLEDQR